MSENNLKINSVLCYICSAKNSLDTEIITSSVFNFYNKNEINEAKNLIYSYTNVEPRRRTGEGKSTRDISDILDILNTIQNESSVDIPTFVTEGWNSLPPPHTEFGPLSRNVNSLSETIYSLNTDLKMIFKKIDEEKSSEEHIIDIKEDISDIKKSQIYQHQELNVIKENISKVEINGISTSIDNSNLSSSYSKSKSPPLLLNMSYAAASKNPPLAPQQPQKQYNRRRKNSSQEVDSSQLTYDEEQNNQPKKNNDDGWTLVQSKHRPKYFKNNSIVGSGDFSLDNNFSSAPRNLDLFIGGCNLNTKPEEIIDFCKRNHKMEVKCTDMNSKSEFRKSFKVTVDSSCRDKLLDNKMWPNGVIVRKFTTRKNHGNLSSNFNNFTQ